MDWFQSLMGAGYFLKYQCSDLYIHTIRKQSYDLKSIINFINDARHKHLLLSGDKLNFFELTYSIGTTVDMVDFYFMEPVREFLSSAFHDPNLFKPNKNVINIEEFLDRCNKLNEGHQLSCTNYSSLEIANLLNALYNLGHFTPHQYVIEKHRNEVIEKFMKHELVATNDIKVRNIFSYELPLIGDFKLDLSAFKWIEIPKTLISFITDLRFYKGSYVEFDSSINIENMRQCLVSDAADYKLLNEGKCDWA